MLPFSVGYATLFSRLCFPGQLAMLTCSAVYPTLFSRICYTKLRIKRTQPSYAVVGAKLGNTSESRSCRNDAISESRNRRPTPVFGSRIVKIDQQISGSKNCRNGVLSGSRNRRNGQQILYGWAASWVASWVAGWLAGKDGN